MNARTGRYGVRQHNVLTLMFISHTKKLRDAKKKKT